MQMFSHDQICIVQSLSLLRKDIIIRVVTLWYFRLNLLNLTEFIVINRTGYGCKDEKDLEIQVWVEN